MQPLPPSSERSNREIQLDSKKRFKVSTRRWKLGPQVAHGLFGFAHFAPRRIRRIICYDSVWHEFSASQPVLTDGPRMAGWSLSRTPRTSRTSGILSVCAHTFPSSPKISCQQTSVHVFSRDDVKRTQKAFIGRTLDWSLESQRGPLH